MDTRHARCRRLAARLLPLLLLAACGGGERPADVFPSTVQPPPRPVAGPDRFLILPNPLQLPGGLAFPAPVDSDDYARAYYRAVDPHDRRTTLADWRRANGFGSGTGEEVSAVFGDFRDLGYGRRMTGRRNADGSLAFVVENYLVNPGAEGYGRGVNLDAALVEDTQWRASINAIEFSVGADADPLAADRVLYAKFYSFDPLTQRRVLRQDLDGRGPKALPGVCISCHGGRADALTASGEFPLLQRSQPTQRGDVRGRLHGFDVHALTFAGGPPSAAEQQALKRMNAFVLCSYPASGAAPPGIGAAGCGRPTGASEWQGSDAAAWLQDAYGGATLPNPNFAELPVPAGWQAEPVLYRDVVAPACLGCHRLLGSGTGVASAIDFGTLAKFESYAERTRHLVYERGNMPLSRLLYQRFWSTDPADGRMAAKLADYLDRAGFGVARTAAGAAREPGFPVAIAGPDRRVNIGETTLSARESLYADGFRWTLRPGAAGVTLSAADTGSPKFVASAAAAGKVYEVDLVATRNGLQSDPATLRIYVNTAAESYPAQAAAKYAAVLQSLQDRGCLGCHVRTTSSAGGEGPLLAFGLPAAPTAADVGDLHHVLRSLLNFDELRASKLLRKPAGDHHFNGRTNGFYSTLQPGDAGFAAGDPRLAPGDARRADRDRLIDWALADGRR